MRFQSLTNCYYTLMKQVLTVSKYNDPAVQSYIQTLDARFCEKASYMIEHQLENNALHEEELARIYIELFRIVHEIPADDILQCLLDLF